MEPISAACLGPLEVVNVFLYLYNGGFAFQAARGNKQEKRLKRFVGGHPGAGVTSPFDYTKVIC